MDLGGDGAGLEPMPLVDLGRFADGGRVADCVGGGG